MGCNCEGQINAIALNRDASHVVVAGRTVFKIYAVDEDRFEEKANLRVGKHITLNYCAADIAWNHVDENILASGATNGAVVLWDLNRHTRNKQEQVFQEHKRTVNRVCFHEVEHTLLLSGSQDGSMKLFDTRKKEMTMSFSVGTTSVRDIQFCPSKLSYFSFASADEGGNVHFWDMRRPDKMEKQFPAHSGPVFTIDWHPEDKNWFGTAGRDKTIKVWDLAKDKAVHTIQCIASVARIRWRPQRRYHLASCALLVDCSINIWDVQRPYIPFATFEKHKDVATSIAWKNGDPHTFLSGSKDCYLYQHVFRDARRPADETVPAGIDMSIDGSIFHANRNKAENKPNTGKYGLFKKPPDRSNKFLNINFYMQNLHVNNLHANNQEEVGCNVNETKKELSMLWFVDCAEKYMLTGFPLEEMCQHNAAVARSQDRHQVAQSWLMLKDFYTTSPILSAQSLHKPPAMSVVSHNTDRIDMDKGKSTAGGRRDSGVDQDEKVVDATSGNSDDEGSDREVSEKHLTSIARGHINPQPDWDMFFDDGDPASYEALDSSRKQEWVLPSEAFQPRHEIAERTRVIDSLPNGHDSPMSAMESDYHIHNSISVTPVQTVTEKKTPTILTADPQTDCLADWTFTNIVVDMLKYFAEEGDVQTPVCMLIVLKDRIRPHVEEMTQENWFLSYIDLLGRFELWTVANEVIQLSDLPGVSMLNQQSTTIHVKCHQCTRPLTKSGWLCDRCKAIVNQCCVCHLPVKGVFIWCQGCSHGGHIEHVMDWFSRNIECPVGCGHLCQYT